MMRVSLLVLAALAVSAVVSVAWQAYLDPGVAPAWLALWSLCR